MQIEVQSSPGRGEHGCIATMRRDARVRGRSYAKVAHHVRVSVGGSNNGVYSFRVSTPADMLPVDPVLVAFTASGSSVDQVCTGLSNGVRSAVTSQSGTNVPALTNTITATADLANDRVELVGVRTGEPFTVELVGNPSSNLSLSTVTSATQSGLALGIGMVDVDGSSARAPTSGDTGASIMGVLAIENNLWREPSTPTADPAALPGANLKIVQAGDIFIMPEVEVAITDPVYCRISASGSEVAGAWRNDCDGVAQVTTCTPDAVNAGIYQLAIVYGPGPGVPLPETYNFAPFTADGSATAAEIVTGVRAILAANAAFTARVVATGTTTVVLTGQDAGVPFSVVSIGATGTWASITETTAASADCVEVKTARWIMGGGPTSGQPAVLSFD